MAHGYRTLQNWDKWLAQQFLGRKVLDAEKEIISELVRQHYGKHAVLIGVPLQQELLTATDISYRTLMTPFLSGKNNFTIIESSFAELPILSGSVDLVILPHTLEFVDNPRHLLAEACRIIKPEGLIIICAFNPFSTWGFKKVISKRHMAVPTGSHFIAPNIIKSWLALSDFEIETHRSVLFTPPVKRESFYNRMHFLERVGALCFPKGGGVSVIVARAKVIPLTPIKMKWKQTFGNIRISTSIPGNIATQSTTSQPPDHT